MPKFVLPGAAGLLVRGNIDIDARALVKVPAGGGKFASVMTCGWEIPQPELSQRFGITNRQTAQICVPQVIRQGHKWVIVNAAAALDHFRKTGRHLGLFDTIKNAQSYANRLHLEQQAAQRR